MTPQNRKDLGIKLRTLRSTYSNDEYVFQKFMSPKVVSMNMDNVRADNPDSINTDYCVTDKADGLSSLLIILGDDLTKNPEDFDKDGKSRFQYLNKAAFLIDSNLKFRSLTLPDIFIDQDTPENMYKIANLDSSSIEEKVLDVLNSNIVLQKQK